DGSKNEAVAEERLDLLLAAANLARRIERPADDLVAEFARCEVENRGADDAQDHVGTVHGTEDPLADAFAQEALGRADDATERCIYGLLLGQGPGELVVLEKRSQQEARIRRVRGEHVGHDVEPALEPLHRAAACRERAHELGLDAVEDARHDGGVELRLAGEVVEQGRLRESDLLGHLGEPDARETAAREELLGAIEDLVARWLSLGGGARHRPSDRSHLTDRSVGCQAATADATQEGSIMAGDSLAGLDATAQAELVRKGEVSPRELVDAAIARIERVDPGLGSVIHPAFDEARAEAAQLPDGPFRGVPMLMKDIGGAEAGRPYCAGMRFLKEARWREAADAYLTRSFK